MAKTLSTTTKKFDLSEYSATAQPQQTVVEVSGGDWHVKIAMTVTGVIAAVIIALVFQWQAGVVLLLIGSGWAAQLFARAYGKYLKSTHEGRRSDAETRMIEAEASVRIEEARKAGYEADIVMHQARQQQLEAAHLERLMDFLPFQDGQWVVDYRTGAVLSTPNKPIRDQNLLAGMVGDDALPSIDFFDAATDLKSVLAIIGTQRCGKTYLAMHLSDYLKSRNLGDRIVIGTKAEPGEWKNCNRFIGARNARAGLRLALEELESRHETNRRDPHLWIFLDDWINVVAAAGDLAEQFFLRAATDMLAAGMTPVFMLQSDSNADWGNKQGAMLKNNFTKIFVVAPRISGKLDPRQATAEVIYPGEREGHPVDLPRGLPMLGGGEQETVAITPAGVMAFDSAEEQAIYEAARSVESGGAVKLNDISRALGWSTGSYSNKKIKPVLEKFGVEIA